MTLSIYLTFDGNCREAFEFYRSVFGGEFQTMSTFADGPQGMPVSNDDKDKIMHASLPIGTSVLMGSDQSDQSPPFVSGSNFSVSVDAESRAHSDELLENLATGGVVTMPMEETFWGAYFGMCTDRFGINWMVVHELASE